MVTFVSALQRPDSFILWTDEITINGATDVIFIEDMSEKPPAWGAVRVGDVGVLLNVLVQYVTASDTNETQNIRIGTSDVINLHASNVNTSSGKVAGDVEVFPQSGFDAEPRLFTSDTDLIVSFVSSTGAGSVRVGLEIIYDYTKWKDFNPQGPV